MAVQQNFYRNSSLSTQVDDFWDEIFARPIVKYGVSIFTLWTLLCLIPFFWISMMFVLNKHYQTMVSYGEAMMCFCGIYVMIGIIIFSVPRLLLGPLPEAVCWCQKFFNQSAPITTMLVFDTYYLARYFYVVVFKTATICKEDFLGFYTFILTLLLGFVFAFVHTMSPGKWGLNYYICMGENPDLYPDIQGSKYPVTVVVALFTLLIYAITNYKLYKAKKRRKQIQALAAPLIQLLIKPVVPEAQGDSEAFWARYFPYANKFFWSSVNLVTMYIVVIIIVTEIIMWNFYMKKLSTMEMKTTTSGHFCYIYHQYFCAPLCLWSVAINSLVRNAEHRKYFFQTITLSN